VTNRIRKGEISEAMVAIPNAQSPTSVTASMQIATPTNTMYFRKTLHELEALDDGPLNATM
jgi:hypothetical protein